MSRRLSTAAAVVAAVLLGCGGGAGDLLAIEVSGGPAGQIAQRIVVTENGQASCNGGPQEAIPNERLIQAREVEREAEGLATRAADLTTREPAARQYVLRTNAGTVRWSEGSPRLPQELGKAALLALQLGRSACR